MKFKYNGSLQLIWQPCHSGNMEPPKVSEWLGSDHHQGSDSETLLWTQRCAALRKYFRKKEKQFHLVTVKSGKRGDFERRANGTWQLREMGSKWEEGLRTTTSAQAWVARRWWSYRERSIRKQTWEDRCQLHWWHSELEELENSWRTDVQGLGRRNVRGLRVICLRRGELKVLFLCLYI